MEIAFPEFPQISSPQISRRKPVHLPSSVIVGHKGLLMPTPPFWRSSEFHSRVLAFSRKMLNRSEGKWETSEKPGTTFPFINFKGLSTYSVICINLISDTATLSPTMFKVCICGKPVDNSGIKHILSILAFVFLQALLSSLMPQAELTLILETHKMFKSQVAALQCFYANNIWKLALPVLN